MSRTFDLHELCYRTSGWCSLPMKSESLCCGEAMSGCCAMLCCLRPVSFALLYFALLLLLSELCHALLLSSRPFSFVNPFSEEILIPAAQHFYLMLQSVLSCFYLVGVFVVLIRDEAFKCRILLSAVCAQIRQRGLLSCGAEYAFPSHRSSLLLEDGFGFDVVHVQRLFHCSSRSRTWRPYSISDRSGGEPFKSESDISV